MSQLPSKQQLLTKIPELESYVQTLQKTNQSKNSQLALLRKKVQLLKDQNMVLKVHSKTTSHDKYSEIQAIVIQLEEKLQVAMQQCITYKAENQKLKRALEVRSRNCEEEERLSVNRVGRHSALMSSSPGKLSYPASILKNKQRKQLGTIDNSVRFNSIEKRANPQQPYSSNNRCQNKRTIPKNDDSLDYPRDSDLVYTEPANRFNTQKADRVFTMIDGNVSFSNLPNQKKNRSSVSNSSSKRDKMKLDSQRSFMFTDGECQALGKIIDQLRDGHRKIKLNY